MELKRFTARSNSLENSMSRMSWHTSASETPASPAARRARPSSVSLKSTPVVSQSRRANSTEWRPKPQGASSTRAPVSSPVAPAIDGPSLAASAPDSTDCEICGHASRKNRSLWNTRGIIFPFVTTLVTGAFGCIGAWVVRGLLASGERPVVFDLGDDPWRVRMIAGSDAPSRVVSVRGDITDRESLGRVVRDHGIRRVIHLAAWQVPLCRQDPPRGAAINVVGTANVFEVARAAAGQVERVVYASSAAVLGRPFQIRWGGSTDLIYTEDVARAVLAAASARLDGARVYNLHGASASVTDVVRTIEAARPAVKGSITHVEQALPFPAALGD